MNRHRPRILNPTTLLLLATALVWAPGCSDDEGGTTTGPSNGAVTVNLDHQVDSQPLVLGINNFAYTNAAGNNYSVDKLRYFVSDIRLHRTNGTTYGVDDYHYRDASDDAGTRSYTISGVPNGTYNAVSFTFGLDPAKNKSGPPISDDPAVSGMEWPGMWGGGWHYLIMEGEYKESGTGTEYAYRTHMGRRFIASGDGGPFANPPGPDAVEYHHEFTVVLPLAAFDVNGDSWETNVIMNINGWYENPQMDFDTAFPQGAGNIMVSNGDQDMLEQNGPGCFTITPAVKQ